MSAAGCQLQRVRLHSSCSTIHRAARPLSSHRDVTIRRIRCPPSHRPSPSACLPTAPAIKYKMEGRGEVGNLDRQIEVLMNRDKLPEEDIKALCEKVRARFSSLGCGGCIPGLCVACSTCWCVAASTSYFMVVVSAMVLWRCSFHAGAACRPRMHSTRRMPATDAAFVAGSGPCIIT